MKCSKLTAAGAVGVLWGQVLRTIFHYKMGEIHRFNLPAFFFFFVMFMFSLIRFAVRPCDVIKWFEEMVRTKWRFGKVLFRENPLAELFVTDFLVAGFLLQLLLHKPFTLFCLYFSFQFLLFFKAWEGGGVRVGEDFSRERVYAAKYPKLFSFLQ